MRIVVAGGSGFVGEPLVRRLIARGDDVAVLSREPSKVRAGRGVQWDGRSAGPWTGEIDTAEAVINLAGENIAEGRWTEERKRRLVASRIDATNAIVAALKSAPSGKRVLINASAIGYYGSDRDEELDEKSSKGQGFLADLVEKWESAANAAQPAARVVVLRFGVVLAAGGGALPPMVMPFRFGAGGRVGSGRQWMSWVGRDDLLAAIEWALDHENARGIYNVTAPAPVRNLDFAKIAGRVLHRPSIMPVPSFALRLMFGEEMAGGILLGGQRVLPRRLQAEGFRFAHAELEPALRTILQR